MKDAKGTMHQVEATKEEKDLGVLIDIELKFHAHTAKVASKANSMLGIIKRTFTYLDTTTVTLLFKTLVRPILEYANCVWSPRFQGDITKLEKVQRRATRLLPELREYSYEERLEILRLPSLAYRRMRGDMLQVYDILNSKVNLQPTDFFTKATGSRRGHSEKLYKTGCRLDVRKAIFSSRVVNEWNSLTEEIVTAPSTDTFKARFDKHWRGRMYKSDPSHSCNAHTSTSISKASIRATIGIA
jgi:hypothetical protein